MTTEFYFVEPVDTLSMRGNQLFGDSGSFGTSQFPPRPSAVSGAFRSLIWKHSGGDIVTVLNSDFAISGLFLALNSANDIEPLWAIPNDVKVSKNQDEGNYNIAYVRPKGLNQSIKSSLDPLLIYTAILEQEVPAKFAQGLLLKRTGIEKYLNDQLIGQDDIVTIDSVLGSELRCGIELNSQTRSAAEHQLFSVEHTVLKPSEIDGISKGLLVAVNGQHESIGDDGYIRLGGDGKVARYKKLEQDFNWFFQRPTDSQFKLTLISPAIFSNGWLPNGITEKKQEYWLDIEGFSARLVCASISRADVVSGWDLENWRPKAAERAVPQGSVYWFDSAQGDWANLEEFLQNAMGLHATLDQRPRWAEGYNRAIIANWNK